MQRRGAKLPPDQPCPCNSGVPYKDCHRPVPRVLPRKETVFPEGAWYARHFAKEHQRTRQQGLGNPMLSTEHRGQRAVSVGNRVHFGFWKTFHEFLAYLVVETLGVEWLKSQSELSEGERHPLWQWYKDLCATAEEIRSANSDAPYHCELMTGSVGLLMRLAYNIYLIDHNHHRSEGLLDRLRKNGEFWGAFYETSVAATFISAGFSIEWIKATQEQTCEFVATHKKTGKSFSVEAKFRKPGKPDSNVATQLNKALKKKADHSRVIFIEINQKDDGSGSYNFVDRAIDTIEERERRNREQPGGDPPAYIFLTNNPHEYYFGKSGYRMSTIPYGYLIPSFPPGGNATYIDEALEARRVHHEMVALLDSIQLHHLIPATFDGEVAGFSFLEKDRRLLVGERYVIECDGVEHSGILIDGSVSPINRTAYCTFRVSNGLITHVSFELSDGEMAAYSESPETFFGVLSATLSSVETPLKFYDWLYDCYKKSNKEQLIKFMEKHRDIENLRNLTQAELTDMYCRRFVQATARRKPNASKPA